MPTALETAKAYREALLKQDAAALGRLARAYHNSFKEIQDKLDLLIYEVNGKQWTAQQTYRAERYQALMAQIAEQLRDLQGLTRNEINTMSRIAIKMGTEHATGLIAAVMGDERLAVAFNRLNPEVIKSLLGFLDPDGALFDRLGKLASTNAQKIADDFLNAVTMGYNPVRIAEIFRQDWGMALTDAMRMTRTAQLYSYREATRANYIANSDVVEGWIWSAELDASTCAECIAMNGTYHDNDETLDDHYNGRCAMIPVVKGFDRIIEEGSGEAWFNEQPESVQRDMLGPGKFQAWQDGKFDFADLSKIVDDPVYGQMRQEATLKELIGENE